MSRWRMVPNNGLTRAKACSKMSSAAPEALHLRPMIAIPSDVQCVKDQTRYTADVVPVDSLVRVIDALPIIVPAIGPALDVTELLDRVDGVFVPGGISNVHPSLYGREATSRHQPFDPARDATTLPLIRDALSLGIPLLLTCRGFQELNVALGGTLKIEDDGKPEHEKHGTPESAKSEDEQYQIRHGLNIKPGGLFARIVRSPRIAVNSLHSQILDQLAPGLAVEAMADDGSVEAVTVTGSPGFGLAVVFHPEYWAERDGPSLAILRAFGAAVRAYASRKKLPQSFQKEREE
jgi:putative glutamine amidotransferase